MEKMLEKLWNEYFSEKCASIASEEERMLVERSAEMHKRVNEVLTEEQCGVVEKYIEALYEIQSYFEKKAFLEGCAFAASFLIEVGPSGNA